MKVYLAAPYGSREQIRLYADELDAAGFQVMSTWLKETHEINAGTQGAATSLPDETVAAHAETDLTDIDLSDVLVLFTSAYVGVEGGGGRHVETGYAIARGTPVVVVGEPENVFHRMLGVHLVADWHHARGRSCAVVSVSDMAETAQVAQVSVFDLTDEQIEQAVAARRANPEPPRASDAYWIASMARARNEAEKTEVRRLASMTRCARCGIDVHRPGLCFDCIDVLALETVA